MFIEEVTQGKSPADYRRERVLRQAVERNIEIIGEAVNRLSREDPETASRIPDAGNIVAFRNALIHGYDVIDDDRMWKTITEDVPRLRRQMDDLLRESQTPE